MAGYCITVFAVTYLADSVSRFGERRAKVRIHNCNTLDNTLIRQTTKCQNAQNIMHKFYKEHTKGLIHNSHKNLQTLVAAQEGAHRADKCTKGSQMT